MPEKKGRRNSLSPTFLLKQASRGRHARHAQWRNPEEVKASHPRASILKGGRAVFNIKGNDYRLIAALQYQAGVLVIRFFGSHAEYDHIDAETV